ncbi:hypothetical protein BGZ61DRAFT_462547 [Ilyonectria robusta]|uniref:uncharacterized protein n=1 Tax=Ilyonectria robusta TaxID=1079257 RepID=UPI001E8CC1B5|nr:uncharacterized protein BGZ61DRAFT_462547 [Ilyonectria robusta]KAH8664959.1 hypothetical protein BGZ61DRAFT_462547 [Ilyonectria robusta]
MASLALATPIPDATQPAAQPSTDVTATPSIQFYPPRPNKNTTVVDRRDTESAAAGLVKRDNCYHDSFSRASAWTLASNLQNQWPDSEVNLPRNTHVSWVEGNVRVCVANMYVFVDSKVKRWEVGWAMNYIDSTCCADGSCNDNYAGGEATAHAPDGLNLLVRVVNAGWEDCRL